VDSSEEIHSLIEEGKNCIQSFNYVRAADVLLCALQLDPYDKLARRLLVRAYFCLNDEELACEHLSFLTVPGYTGKIMTVSGPPKNNLLTKVFLETFRFTPFGNRIIYHDRVSSRRIENHPLVCGVYQDKLLVMVPKIEGVIINPCVLLGGDTNYFKWMLSILPRLKKFFSESGLQKYPLVVNSHLTSFQKESLEMLGISDDQLLPLKTKCFFACNILHILPKVLLKDSLYVRERLMPKLSIPPKKRIFLYRGKSCRRVLINEDEVYEKLQPLGFKKIEAGKLSIKEQIAEFSSAKVIVGTHDAGFANLIFTNPGTQVLELTHKKNEMPNFEVISRFLGLSYQKCIGKPLLEKEGMSPFEGQMSDYTVDVDEVMIIVKEMLSK
jgi:Glycosyltransferase 61